MIEIIVKRDGTKEPFSPSKVNGWGVWASEKLGSEVDWGSVVIEAVMKCPKECPSETLQNALISTCVSKKTWEYNRMAGRLLSALLDKKLYNDEIPTIKKLHEDLVEAGLMVKLDYSDEEYATIEQFINHKQNLKYPHYQLHQLRNKYALRNKFSKKEYETAQFVYMRMAMALAEDEPKETRLVDVKEWYDHFSHSRINAPTPAYTNLGTKLNGYASCCVYSSGDTWHSLAAGDHIAYAMTCMSAGIGTHLKTRSLGDPVRGGMILHQGKLPYIRAMVGAIGANLQNGRGGASTVHYTAFDPEVEVMQKLRNPMTPATKQIRGCHYSFGSNKFFARKVARNESIALFSYMDAPELYESQYEKDPSKFENLYNEYLNSPKTKTMVSARELLINAQNEAYETGTHYLHMFDALNEHTPFVDKIYQSNLCQEIAIPSKPYNNVGDLYEEYNDSHGEIGLCSLAGIVPSNITSDKQYASAAYYALKMIDKFINKSSYVFKSLEHTAKSRMSAGVGIIGLAHHMAKNNMKYSSAEGRNFVHEIAETHMWHLINASLRLGKELGNAPWMHKTLWPKGWLPIDTYAKTVDELVTVENKRDWEWLRSEIIANGGIRNSVVSAHMPAESSASGMGLTNGLYPVRDLSLNKSNDTDAFVWVAPDATKLKNKYELAYDIPTEDMIKFYAIIQKWTDQGISADLYRKIIGDEKVTTTEMITDYLCMVRYGLKSRYYVNSQTSKGIDLSATDVMTSSVDASDEVGCASGSCTL